MTRIDRPSREPARPESDEPTAEAAREARKSDSQKPAPPGPEHTAASRQLARRPSPASLFAANVLVSEKRPATPSRQPLPIDGYPGAREVERLLIPSDAPPLPPQPQVTRPNVRPGTRPETPEARSSKSAEPDKVYRNAAAQYDKLSRGLAASEKAWLAIADARRARVQADPANPARAGLQQTVFDAERQAELCRTSRRELEERFGALTTQWELVTGRRKGAAIGPATQTGTARARAELERMRNRLDRYNKAVDALKSGGAISTVVTTLYLAEVAREGRPLRDADYAAIEEMQRVLKIADGLGRFGPAPATASPAQPTKTPTEIRPQR